jgi:hypothetical protein
MPLRFVSQTLGHASVVVTNDFYGIFAVYELQNAVDHYYKSPRFSKKASLLSHWLRVRVSSRPLKSPLVERAFFVFSQAGLYH